MVSFRVSFRVSLEFHFGFFPVSCRVSNRDFLSGVQNVQMGFFRASLGFHLGFRWGFFRVSFRVSFRGSFRVSLGFQFGFHLGLI